MDPGGLVGSSQMSNLMRRFRRLVTPASLAVFLVVGSVGQAAALSGGYPNQSLGNRGVNVAA